MSSYIINPYLFNTDNNNTEFTWNSADKSTTMNLYDDDLGAWAPSGSPENVRGTVGFATGKHCWCIVVGNNSTGTHPWRSGIATSTFDLNADTLGGSTTSVAIDNVGVVRYNSGTLADYATFGNYARMMVAFDADAGDIWFGADGAWLAGDPSAGTGAVKNDIAAGTWYPIWGTTGTPPAVGKGLLIPWPTAYTIPTGFTPAGPAPNVDGKHWETVFFQQCHGVASGAWNGQDIRCPITAAQLKDISGTKIRVYLAGAPSGTENATVSAAHFGEVAGAGDAYDMAAAGTALNVGGTNAFTINQGAITVSDDLTYTYAGTTGLLFNFHFNDASHDAIGGINSIAGYNTYFKVTAAETGTANVSAYSTSANNHRFIQEVQAYVDD